MAVVLPTWIASLVLRNQRTVAAVATLRGEFTAGKWAFLGAVGSPARRTSGQQF